MEREKKEVRKGKREGRRRDERKGKKKDRESETTIFQRDRRWYDNEVSERFDRDRPVLGAPCKVYDSTVLRQFAFRVASCQEDTSSFPTLPPLHSSIPFE